MLISFFRFILTIPTMMKEICCESTPLIQGKNLPLHFIRILDDLLNHHLSILSKKKKQILYVSRFPPLPLPFLSSHSSSFPRPFLSFTHQKPNTSIQGPRPFLSSHSSQTQHQYSKPPYPSSSPHENRLKFRSHFFTPLRENTHLPPSSPSLLKLQITGSYSIAYNPISATATAI